MVWHFLVLHARGPAATADTVTASGYVPTGLRLPVREAVAELDDLAPGGIAVVEQDGPGIQAVARFFDHDDLARALSASGGETLTFLGQASTDTYVVSSFRDGRPHRRLVRVEDEVVVDEGPALAAETEVDWSDPEMALQELARSLTGEPIGTDAWLDCLSRLRRRRRRPS